MVTASLSKPQPQKKKKMQDNETSSDDPLARYPWKLPLNLAPDLFPGFYFEIINTPISAILTFFSEETGQHHSPWDEENNRRVPAITIFWHNGHRSERFCHHGKSHRVDFLDDEETLLLPAYTLFTNLVQRHYIVNGVNLFVGLFSTLTKDSKEEMAEAAHEWIAKHQPLIKSANKK